MQLLRHHDFAMIWFAGLLTYVGSGMFFVALPIWVYQEYGSATLVGTAALMAVIPTVALGSLAGIFVDRWNRTRVMVLVTIARVGLFLALAFATQVEWFWLILVVRFSTSSAMQFFLPAEQSLLPKLVDNDAELVQANSLNQLNNNLGGIVGNGLGGVMLLWIGIEGIAVAMASLSAIGAVLLSRIHYVDRRTRVASDETLQPFSVSRSISNLTDEWRAGLAIFTKNQSVRILFTIFLVASVTNVGFTTLLPVFALETLNANEAGVGLILMMMSVGGMLGAISLGFIAVKTPAHRLLQLSILVSALFDIVFYGYPVFIGGTLLLSCAIKFLDGFPNAGINATGMTLFQTRVPEHLLGRALGTFSSLQATVMLVATPIAGLLADLFSAQAVLLSITFFVFASWVMSLRLSEEVCDVPSGHEPEPQVG